MRGINEHLSIQEMERLTSADADTATGALEDAMRHLESCDDCRFRLLGVELPEKLSSGGAERTSECPAEKVWLNLAVGLLPQSEVPSLLGHAVKCGYCGPLLKIAIEDLAMDFTPEEEARVKTLESAKPKWQEELIGKIRGAAGLSSAESPKRTLVWWPKLAWASLAIFVILGSTLIYLQRMHDHDDDPNDLLAQAYTEQRTIELRLPSAKYAPPRVKRGSQDTIIARPASLMKAELLIKLNLQKDPHNPRWLQAEGRAELLEGKYAVAVETFRKALDADPMSSSLKSDQAIAYFERAESGGLNEDYGNSVELLGQVLEANPNNAVALFNRAIVYEHIHFYNESIGDFEQYLKLDPSGDWAGEAKRLLEEARLKLKKQRDNTKLPLLSPSALASSVSTTDETTWLIVEPRIEDYMDVAICEWLPAAFPPKHVDSTPNEISAQMSAISALNILATVLISRHGDHWLSDFLTAAPSSSKIMALGIRQLANSIKSNRSGDPFQAQQSALNADGLFLKIQNRPGQVFAERERVYGLQRAQKGNECLAASNELESSFSKIDFPWLASHLSLDRASCWGKVGNLDESKRLAAAVIQANRAGGFQQIYLRALAIAADVEVSKGNYENAWILDREGLQALWDCGCPPLRAYTFYDSLEYIAEETAQPYFALAAAMEAVSAIKDTSNTTSEAMARYRLALAAKTVGRSAESEKEFILAKNLFATKSLAKGTRIYLINSELFLAELYRQKGEEDLALQLLDTIESDVAQISNYQVSLQFYRTRAAIWLAKQQYSMAERSAAQSLQIAERGLGSIAASGDRIAWRNETDDVYRLYLESHIKGRNNSTQALEFWEWYRAASIEMHETKSIDYSGVRIGHSRSLSGIKIDIAAMSGSSDNITLISYALVPGGLVIWWVNNKKIESQIISISKEYLFIHVQRFLALCGNPSSGMQELQEEGRLLFKLLIGPVMKHIRDDAVVVLEPDGPLSDLPFQALIDGDGRYFGELHAIIVSPGLAFHKIEKTDLISTRDRALVVSPKLSSSDHWDLPPLPSASKEADEVAGLFTTGILLTGPDATIEAVRKGLAYSAVLHFASHAIVYGKNSGILLASAAEGATNLDLEIWGAGRIRNANLRGIKLVVLSSCTTGKRNMQMRLDPDDVISALLHAGVTHVVASKWNVDSEFTRAYMKSFYLSLLSGRPVAEALRTAASSARNRPESAHPYYWASFADFGESWPK